MEDIIINNLLNEIHNGMYSPGEMLPSENTLSRLYQVPRVTVRNAYNQLEERGYLNSRKGKGRFLRAKKQQLALDLNGKKSFTEKLKSLDRSYESWNMGTEKTIAGSKMASLLGIKTEADDDRKDLYKVSLLRMIDDEPAAIHCSFISAERFSGSAAPNKSITSMYGFFKENGYCDFTSGNIELSVSFPGLEEQKTLGCPPLVPLLLLEYSTFAVNAAEKQLSKHKGKPGSVVLSWNKIAYRSDRFSFSL